MTASSQAAAQSAVANCGVDEQKDRASFNTRLAVVGAAVAFVLIVRVGLSLISVPSMAVADVAALVLMSRLVSLVRGGRLTQTCLEPCAFGLTLFI